MKKAIAFIIISMLTLAGLGTAAYSQEKSKTEAKTALVKANADAKAAAEKAAADNAELIAQLQTLKDEMDRTAHENEIIRDSLKPGGVCKSNLLKRTLIGAAYCDWTNSDDIMDITPGPVL